MNSPIEAFTFSWNLNISSANAGGFASVVPHSEALTLRSSMAKWEKIAAENSISTHGCARLSLFLFFVVVWCVPGRYCVPKNVSAIALASFVMQIKKSVKHRAPTRAQMHKERKERGNVGKLNVVSTAIDAESWSRSKHTLSFHVEILIFRRMRVSRSIAQQQTPIQSSKDTSEKLSSSSPSLEHSMGTQQTHTHNLFDFLSVDSRQRRFNIDFIADSSDSKSAFGWLAGNDTADRQTAASVLTEITVEPMGDSTGNFATAFNNSQNSSVPANFQLTKLSWNISAKTRDYFRFASFPQYPVRFICLHYNLLQLIRISKHAVCV